MFKVITLPVSSYNGRCVLTIALCAKGKVHRRWSLQASWFDCAIPLCPYQV